MKAQQLRKLGLWRLLSGKTLGQVAREVRYRPTSSRRSSGAKTHAPGPRAKRFAEAYGEAVAADLLKPVEPVEALGPAAGSAAAGSDREVLVNE